MSPEGFVQSKPPKRDWHWPGFWEGVMFGVVLAFALIGLGVLYATA